MNNEYFFVEKIDANKDNCKANENFNGFGTTRKRCRQKKNNNTSKEGPSKKMVSIECVSF